MAARRSAGQPTKGGMARVAGAAMRIRPTRLRLWRSRIAFVQWVVPSMACLIAPGSRPGCPSTNPWSALRMPLVTSGVVGDLKLASKSERSFNTTASVFVPPTSIPRRKVIRGPPGPRKSCEQEIPDRFDPNSHRIARQVAERDVFHVHHTDRRRIGPGGDGLAARLGFGRLQGLVAAHAGQREDPVDLAADL